MKQITLKPVDSFYFKNHALTTAGNENESIYDSLFPPRPNTIYGALRSGYIHAHSSIPMFYREADEHVKKWMGSRFEKGEFSLRGLFIKKGDELLMPAPLDYQQIDERHIVQLEIKKREKSALNSGESAYLLYLNISEKKKVKSLNGKYLSLTGWKRVILNGGYAVIDSRNNNIQFYNKEDLIFQEHKLGIRIDPQTGRTKKGFLYTKTMNRFVNDVALVACTNNAPSFEDVIFIQLGGSNRPWTVEENRDKLHIWTKEEKERMKEQIARTKRARIHLLTPAIWKNGTKPEKCTENGTWHITDEITVRLLTAAIDRPEIYGGWDIARHRPKERRFMIPAGSVLYIEVDDVERLDKLFNGVSISEEFTEEGFGFAVLSQ